VALAGLSSGCFRVRYKMGSAVPEPGAPREQWHHTLVLGLLPVSGPVRVADACPSGVAMVEAEETFANGAVENLTSIPFSVPSLLAPPNPVASMAFTYLVVGRHLDVWTPTTVRLWCARAPSRSLKLVVVQLQPRGGVEAATVALFTDALVGELRRSPGVSVMTDADVAAVIGVERQRQLLGCSDSSCLTEIGGALGVDRIVHGSVGRVGGSLVVNLTSIDPAAGRPVASVSERLKGGSDEAFLDALPSLTYQLLVENLAPAGP
jgi:hypothetical protein